jgi:hypothetical protein
MSIHILPRVHDGKTRLSNLALACVTCSLRKGARTRVRDMQSGYSVRLFHPRRNAWSDHFRWTRGWRLSGLTPIGGDPQNPRSAGEVSCRMNEQFD